MFYFPYRRWCTRRARFWLFHEPALTCRDVSGEISYSNHSITKIVRCQAFWNVARGIERRKCHIRVKVTEDCAYVCVSLFGCERILRGKFHFSWSKWNLHFLRPFLIHSQTFTRQFGHLIGDFRCSQSSYHRFFPKRNENERGNETKFSETLFTKRRDLPFLPKANVIRGICFEDFQDRDWLIFTFIRLFLPSTSRRGNSKNKTELAEKLCEREISSALTVWNENSSQSLLRSLAKLSVSLSCAQSYTTAGNIQKEDVRQWRTSGDFYVRFQSKRQFQRLVTMSGVIFMRSILSTSISISIYRESPTTKWKLIARLPKVFFSIFLGLFLQLSKAAVTS